MRAQRHVTTLILLLACTGMSIAGTPDATVRAFFSSVSPQSRYSAVVKGIPTTLEGQSGSGLGASYEIRGGKHLGLEFGMLIADVDFELSVPSGSADFGSAVMIPLTLGMNYHLRREGRLDFYFGPMLSYTLWGNLSNEVGSSKLDSDFGIGAVLGVDVPLGSSGWTFTVSARYLRTAAGDASVEIDVDPIFFSLGLGYDF